MKEEKSKRFQQRPLSTNTALLEQRGYNFCLFLAFLMYLILYKTILGYEIRAVGLGSKAAKHGGINLSKNILSVGILSGGLAGLAGMVEVAGTHHLLIQGFSPGFGYQGIAIAALTVPCRRK